MADEDEDELKDLEAGLSGGQRGQRDGTEVLLGGVADRLNVGEDDDSDGDRLWLSSKFYDV